MQVHDQHFAQNAPDVFWIAEVTQRGWVILTKDLEHHRKANERSVILQTRAREFALSNGISGAEMGRIFAAALPSIQRYLQNSAGPFIVRVRRSLQLIRIL